MRDTAAAHLAVRLDAKPFREAVERVKSAVGRKSSFPIVQHIRVSTGDGETTFTATDLDAEWRAGCPAEVMRGYDACIHADTLAAFAKRAKGSVSISVAENGRTVLSSGRAELEVATLPGEDFPALASEDAPEWPLTTSALSDLISYCLPAISTEETRYYLCGVYLHVRDGSVMAASTDGNALAHMVGPDCDEREGIIIPTTAARIIAGIDAEGVVRANSRYIEVTGDGWSYRSKGVEGTFPDYTRVIPKPAGMRLSVSGDDLSEALADACIGGSRSNAIKLDPGDDGLSISRRSDESAVLTSIECEVTEGHAAGFNARYLANCLSVLDGPDLVVRMEDFGTPSLWRGTNPDQLFVIMPMRV